MSIRYCSANVLQQIHKVTEEVALAEQEVLPHGAKVVEQLVLVKKNVQKPTNKHSTGEQRTESGTNAADLTLVIRPFPNLRLGCCAKRIVDRLCQRCGPRRIKPYGASYK